MIALIRKLTLCVCALALFSPPVGASPCNDDADLPDTALWATHNCWWDFVLWQYQAYRMFNSDVTVNDSGLSAVASSVRGMLMVRLPLRLQ